MGRPGQINLRVSDEEEEFFAEVAEHYGMTIAGVIRMLVEREALLLRGPAADPFERPLSTDEREYYIRLLRVLGNAKHEHLTVPQVIARLEPEHAVTMARWVPSGLNNLRRANYVVKQKAAYRLTNEGAVLAALRRMQALGTPEADAYDLDVLLVQSGFMDPIDKRETLTDLAKAGRIARRADDPTSPHPRKVWYRMLTSQERAENLAK